ncbi:MAG: M23 family metallopeptidase [Actinomycetota bacterium]
MRKVRTLLAVVAITATAVVATGGVVTAVDLSRELDAEVRELEYFPVVDDEVWYPPNFLAPRGGGTRLHQGVDIFAPKGAPLLSPVDAVVDRLDFEDTGLSGNYVVLRDADGWEYVYVHLNNDTPGTDDGANPRELIAPLDIEVGAEVEAGQVVGFNGDSGNAENTPAHLHFEIRRPDGTRLNPFPSLQLARGVEIGDVCTWSRNPDREPDEASGRGYWTADAAGRVTATGDAVDHGGVGDLELKGDVLGMTPTHTGGGYWLVAEDGGIFALGDAEFHGSTGAMVLNEPVMSMAALPGGEGYWLVAADGGIFAFGETEFFGSMGGRPLNEPVVGMVPTPSGDGYLLVARDGGVFAFGDAEFFGSLPGIGVEADVVAVAVAPDAEGYWVLTRQGGIYPFGDVEWHGSVQSGGLCGERLAVAIAPSATGEGYWVLTDDGRVWPFGDAVDFESTDTEEPTADDGGDEAELVGEAVALSAVPPGAELPDPDDEQGELDPPADGEDEQDPPVEDDPPADDDPPVDEAPIGDGEQPPTTEATGEQIEAG